MRTLVLIIPLAAALSLAGCKAQTTVAPVSYRSFRTSDKRTGTITADGRMRNAYVGGSKVCAEPPPDIAATYDLQKAVNASVSVAVLYAGFSGEGKGAGDSMWKGTSDVADVAEKTEALMVVRESLYRLCELSLNTKIDADTAVSIFRELLYTTRDLGRHDVLEQIVEAIEYSVGFEGTTPEVLAQLTQLAAHIATIETYQSVLLTASSIPDEGTRDTLLSTLSLALAQQLAVFPGPTTPAAASPNSVNALLSALSARAGFVKKKANEGWQVKKAAGALDVAGFNDNDVITHVRVGEETHNLADLDASGLDSLLVQITASNPESVEFDIKRGTQTHTISFAP